MFGPALDSMIVEFLDRNEVVEPVDIVGAGPRGEVHPLPAAPDVAAPIGVLLRLLHIDADRLVADQHILHVEERGGLAIKAIGAGAVGGRLLEMQITQDHRVRAARAEIDDSLGRALDHGRGRTVLREAVLRVAFEPAVGRGRDRGVAAIGARGRPHLPARGDRRVDGRRIVGRAIAARAEPAAVDRARIDPLPAARPALVGIEDEAAIGGRRRTRLPDKGSAAAVVRARIGADYDLLALAQRRFSQRPHRCDIGHRCARAVRDAETIATPRRFAKQSRWE